MYHLLAVRLVFERAPQPRGEDGVHAPAEAVHRDADAGIVLAPSWCPVGVEDLRRAKASSGASAQNPASSVFDSRQAGTWRRGRSVIATRDRNPRRTGMQVVSAHHRWFGRAIARPRSRDGPTGRLKTRQAHQRRRLREIGLDDGRCDSGNPFRSKGGSRQPAPPDREGSPETTGKGPEGRSLSPFGSRFPSGAGTARPNRRTFGTIAIREGCPGGNCSAARSGAGSFGLACRHDDPTRIQVRDCLFYCHVCRHEGGDRFLAFLQEATRFLLLLTTA